jgi:hypothetical protein
MVRGDLTAWTHCAALRKRLRAGYGGDGDKVTLLRKLRGRLYGEWTGVQAS